MRLATARAFLLLVGLGLSMGVAACDRSAWVRILDARPSRDESKRVVVDVQLEAVEQGGGAVGEYCVSVHWFNFGFDPRTDVVGQYAGELDTEGGKAAEQCNRDLADGDQRTYRFVSRSADFAKGQPGRVQLRHARAFEHREIFAP